MLQGGRCVQPACARPDDDAAPRPGRGIGPLAQFSKPLAKIVSSTTSTGTLNSTVLLASLLS